MEKCEWCGKKKYTSDEQWTGVEYELNGKREIFSFCCNGHASRFANETNYKPYNERKCYYCGVKYDRVDGISTFLRRAGTYNKYDYCSIECAENHYQTGKYILVNSSGFTKNEEIELSKQLKESDRKRKAESKEKNKSLWYKKIISHTLSALLFLIGVFLICNVFTSIFYKIIGTFLFYVSYYSSSYDYIRGKSNFTWQLRSISKPILVKYFNDARVLDDGFNYNLAEDHFGIIISIPYYIIEKFYEQIPVIYFILKIFIITV